MLYIYFHPSLPPVHYCVDLIVVSRTNLQCDASLKVNQFDIGQRAPIHMAFLVHIVGDTCYNARAFLGGRNQFLKHPPGTMDLN